MNNELMKVIEEMKWKENDDDWMNEIGGYVYEEDLIKKLNEMEKNGEENENGYYVVDGIEYGLSYCYCDIDIEDIKDYRILDDWNGFYCLVILYNDNSCVWYDRCEDSCDNEFDWDEVK